MTNRDYYEVLEAREKSTTQPLANTKPDVIIPVPRLALVFGPSEVFLFGGTHK